MPVVFHQPDPDTLAPELTDETRALIHQDQQGSALLSALQAQTREDKIRLQARRKAADEDRIERLAALEAGTLTDSATRYLQRLEASALDDLTGIPDPIPVIGHTPHHGLLYRNTVNYLVGASGSYKTIVALDMAARVGAGIDWCGMPVTQGKALYIIAEGLGGMKFRKQAWEEYHNHGQPMRNITFIPFAIQIPDLEMEMPALIQYARAGGYTFIVFDTQAMCTLGHDENKNDEMALVIDAAQKLAAATQGCILLVAHTGVSDQNRIRGASGQYANVNTVITAYREGSSKTVRLSTARSKGGKQKDAKEIDAINFLTEEIGHHIVLTQGAIDAEAQRRAGLPELRGKYDIAVLNALMEHQNLGASAAAIKTYMHEMGVRTSSGGRLGRKTVDQVIDRLVGDKILSGGPKHKVTAVGIDVLEGERAREEGQFS
ncbi:AAA family ATPase [Streptomyces sp. NPDC001774]